MKSITGSILEVGLEGVDRDRPERVGAGAPTTRGRRSEQCRPTAGLRPPPATGVGEDVQTGQVDPDADVDYHVAGEGEAYTGSTATRRTG